MTCRILIVEDEYWTARHLAMELQDRGVIVLGPTGSIPKALELLAARRRPHAVILDVQLRTELVFPLADTLSNLGTPFVFVTGYEQEDMPERFISVPHFVKPFNSKDCVEAVLALAMKNKQSVA